MLKDVGSYSDISLPKTQISPLRLQIPSLLDSLCSILREVSYRYKESDHRDNCIENNRLEITLGLKGKRFKAHRVSYSSFWSTTFSSSPRFHGSRRRFGIGCCEWGGDVYVSRSQRSSVVGALRQELFLAVKVHMILGTNADF